MRVTCSATSASAQHPQTLKEVPVVPLVGNSCSPGATGEEEQSSRLSRGCGGPCGDRNGDKSLSNSQVQNTVDGKRKPAVHELEGWPRVGTSASPSCMHRVRLWGVTLGQTHDFGT